MVPDTRRADLHLHTSYSDGMLSPAALVEGVVAAGLAVMAVTDHDSMEGVPAAVAAAAGRVEVIPGIELTVAFREVELHVLGYFLEAVAVRDRLVQLRQLREQRIQQMVDRLKTYGVAVTMAEVLQISGEGAVGRPHLARVLQQKGYVKTPEEAFDRFLGDQAPCFVKGATMTPADAALFIRDAGGVSSLAHPARFVPDAWLPELIAAGIQGIEAYHPDHGAGTADAYRQYAEEHQLVVTGGSDFHGSWKTNGPAIGCVTVPVAEVERLRRAARVTPGA